MTGRVDPPARLDAPARFDPASAEQRWQARWAEQGCFAADSASTKPKAYVLEMFPYPSGRIHMGHEQALFLDLFEAGLVYRKESEVNWDPVDMTVLANEQVIDGKGWRSGAPVERRKLSQWFLKITDFAEELLHGLATLDQWPDKVRLMQENWIGKSRGLQFRFARPEPVGGASEIDVFTTRPDTIFGA